MDAPARLLLVVDTGADGILLEVRRAVAESTEDIEQFELKAVEALLSVSSKRLVRPDAVVMYRCLETIYCSLIGRIGLGNPWYSPDLHMFVQSSFTRTSLCTSARLVSSAMNKLL